MSKFQVLIWPIIVAAVLGYRLLPLSRLTPRHKVLLPLHDNSVALSALALSDWLIEQGCKTEDSNIEIASKDSRYVAVAKKDLQKGEILLSLPSGLALDNGKLHNKVKELAPLLSRLKTKDMGILALNLLAERASASGSKWSTYISQLPYPSPGVLQWPDKERELFIQSTTYDSTKYFQAVEHDIQLLESLDSRTQESFVAKNDDLGTIAELFRWAMGTVKSRALLVEGQYVLLPGIDSIAADMWAEGEVSLGGAGIFGGKVYKVSTDRPYKKGERVCMSYGVRAAAEWVLDMGSKPSLPSPDMASCELSFTIESSDAFPEDKIGILERAKRGIKSRFEMWVDPAEGLDPEMIRFIRLKLIRGKDAFILESVFAKTVFETLSLPFSKPNEIAVYQYLEETITREISKLTLADKHHSAGIRPEVQEILMELRRQELMTLEANLEVVKKQLMILQGPGDTNEYYQERRLRELDLLRPLDESEINVY